MRKYWNIFFLGLTLFMACKPSTEKENNVELRESLSVIVDSFIRSNSNKKVYELYIDKIDPHNGILILYAGDCSLIESENLYNNQRSNIFTLSNNKKINIYSGLERYVKNTELKIDSVEHKNNLDKTVWIVRDSFNVFKVYKNYKPTYPFMPIIFDNPEFVTPEL